MNLFEYIFRKYETDKVTAWGYQDAYEDSFLAIRFDVKLVFEIGVFQGGSLHGFSEYFPNALIIGIDVNEKCYFGHDRIKVEIGDATDKEFIDGLVLKYGEPDIVIDDGSHTSLAIRRSFDLLFNRTKICYVIEDLTTQYQEYWTAGNESFSVMIHHLVDEILMARDMLKSIRIYHSILFLFKKVVADENDSCDSGILQS